MRGDFALIQTGGFLGWIIEVGTLSRVNHAALLTTDGDLAILEATPQHGIVPGDMSEYHGKVQYLSNGQITLTDEQRNAILERANMLRGTKYGFLDIVALSLWSTLHLRFSWLETMVKRQDRMICSQFIADCYAFADVELVPGKEPQEVTPGDLAAFLAQH